MESETDLINLLNMVRSKQSVEKVLKVLEAQTDLIPVFIKLFLNGDEKMAKNCAWVLGHLAEKHPEHINPYLPELIKHLKNKNHHDAVKRSITRSLSFAQLNEELMGECYETCYSLFLDRSEAIAIRVFSLRVLQKIAVKNPELMDELCASIELELALPVSTGFRNCAEKVLNGKF